MLKPLLQRASGSFPYYGGLNRMELEYQDPDPRKDPYNPQRELIGFIHETTGVIVSEVVPIERDTYEKHNNQKQKLPKHVLIKPEQTKIKYGTSGESYRTLVNFVRPSGFPKVYRSSVYKVATARMMRARVLIFVFWLLVTLGFMSAATWSYFTETPWPTTAACLMAAVICGIFAGRFRKGNLSHYRVELEGSTHPFADHGSYRFIQSLKKVEGVSKVFVLVTINRWGGRIAKCDFDAVCYPVVVFGSVLYKLEHPLLLKQHSI